MKVKIIEGNNPRELELNINEFIEKPSIKVSDIKYQVESDSSFWSITALIMYENTTPTQIKQKTFDEWANDDEINEFMKEHDVIKVEHFGDLGEVTTIIT